MNKAFPRKFLLLAVLYVQFECCNAQVTIIGRDTVEFIGMKKSTIDKLTDSSHNFAACAQVMKEKFGFSEIAAYKFQENSSFRQILIGIEPGDLHYVNYTPGTDYFSSETIFKLASDEESYFRKGSPIASVIIDVSRYQQGKILSSKTEFKPDPHRYSDEHFKLAPAIFLTLDRLYKEVTIDDVIRVIQTNKNDEQRVVAVALLSFYNKDDRSYFSLIKSLKDPSEIVRSAAWSQVFGMSNNLVRNINWQYSKDLQDLMNGTNIKAYYLLLQLLTGSRISPDTGKSLINPMSKKLVIGFANSSSNLLRNCGRQFLEQINLANK